jgi:hypothetical protein
MALLSAICSPPTGKGMQKRYHSCVAIQQALGTCRGTGQTAWRRPARQPSPAPRRQRGHEAEELHRELIRVAVIRAEPGGDVRDPVQVEDADDGVADGGHGPVRAAGAAGVFPEHDITNILVHVGDGLAGHRLADRRAPGLPLAGGIWHVAGDEQQQFPAQRALPVLVPQGTFPGRGQLRGVSVSAAGRPCSCRKPHPCWLEPLYGRGPTLYTITLVRWETP